MNKILLVVSTLFLVACGGEAPVSSGAPDADTWSPLACRTVPTAYELNRCHEQFGTCPGGGNLPFGLFCDSGHWQCRPNYDRCPPVSTDAGTPADAETDAGQPADVVTDAGTRFAVETINDGPVSQGILPGSEREVLLAFRWRFTQRVELRSVSVTLEADALTLGVVNQDGRPLVNGIRLTDLDTNADLMGPLTLSSTNLNARAIASELEGRARFEPGRWYRLAITGTVAGRIDPELFGRAFHLRIGDGQSLFSSESIYLVDEGRQHAPARDGVTGMAIPEEGRPMTGNSLWIPQPRVSVAIHRELPSLQTVTRNERSIRAMTISVSNSSGAAIRPVGVTYTVAADLGYGYRTQNAHRVLLACSHACAFGAGWMQPRSFNTEGRIGFGAFAPPIAAGTATACTLTCAADSVVEGRDGDRFAVGIANPADVTFEDEFGNAAIVDLDDRLPRQLSAPTHTVTVVNNGMLSIAANPVSNINIVGTEYGWVRVASYNLALSYESATLRRVGVRVAGNPRCVREIQVRTPTGIVGRGTIPSGMTMTNIETFDPLLSVGYTELTLEASLNPTVDPAMDPNGCHVGDSVSFALMYGDNSWGPGYETATNLLAVGTVSGVYLTYGGPPGLGATVFFLR